MLRIAHVSDLHVLAPAGVELRRVLFNKRVLVVEDPSVARPFEATIDAMLTSSTRVRRDDPAWQQLAARRMWMRHWPGVLSV